VSAVCLKGVACERSELRGQPGSLGVTALAGEPCVPAHVAIRKTSSPEKRDAEPDSGRAAAVT
jgi:hypothetical protein